MRKEEINRDRQDEKKKHDKNYEALMLESVS
jgi:hypothetical protein